jgi:hypothetical protein
MKPTASMLYPEGGEERFILNVGKLVSDYIASQAVMGEVSI